MSPTVPPISTIVTSTSVDFETFYALFDLIRDMRDDLHGLSQIITMALLGDHGIIYFAGGNAAVLRKLCMGEALIMPQIQVCFRAVISDIHFPVLIRVHGAGVHVQILII